MINPASLKQIAPQREIIDQNDNFAYVVPCQALRQWVSNFTLSFPDETMISDNYTVMPHGSVTLVYYHNDTGLHDRLFGPMTEPKVVGDIANKCQFIFIVEFQPAGFYPFSECQQSELVNGIYSFSTINPLIDTEIRQILAIEKEAEPVFSSVERLLLDNLGVTCPEVLTRAVALISQSQGRILLKAVVETLSYSDRQLNRFFNQYLGLSMKGFARVVRLNHALRYLNDPQKTVATICDELGYYDTAHYAKDFKLICGVTPLNYRQNLSDFYNEVAKFSSYT